MSSDLKGGESQSSVHPGLGLANILLTSGPQSVSTGQYGTSWHLLETLDI